MSDRKCAKKVMGGKPISEATPQQLRKIEKLSGEEIPESPSTNPIFLKNVSYTDKVYRNMIIEMNKFIRQQRHLSQE